MAASSIDAQAADAPDTLIARVLRWAAEHPHKVAHRFLGSDGKTVASNTYGELEAKSRVLAAELLSGSSRPSGCPVLEPGQRVLLVFLPSLEFIVAFLACLRAGIVAVPVYPPNPRGLAHHLRAFASIADTCGATAVLTHRDFSSARRLGAMAAAGARALAAVMGGSAGGKSEWPDLPWWDVTSVMSAAGHKGHEVAAPAGFLSPTPRLMADPAFLQFTSGSTSEPKGVVISHRSMTHNLRTIVHALRAGQDTRVVSWLPQYHDMGLIGSHCGLLFCGGTGTYFSPIAFVQNPAMLLSIMEASGASHVQMPNFGYALTARKTSSCPVAGSSGGEAGVAGLAPVAHLFNAAEPVTSAACDAFVRVATMRGMRAAAMSPGYGLAESTVYALECLTGASQVFGVGTA
ncbi:hypothetical protein FNF27_01786 [Cafeteria roenbergensis]|uniref:AMP-dependent synthetase/ligase domain-containing protein n=1 Tax=Cafeteria roenbergensis TaxID=33653 RepID=A0A5A8DCC1_CAFRO|nr:hypothetical protein FNF29_08226 [Cafeteria roenbergensis]KAA0150246.1 hypothetical protein FNF31_07054 [Cafeteria roenbergensis]KAA0161840.1 hypothetical protein FNF28_04905 [Cafeteria roenbergensis]KAA0176964.1 hypothetical protein FNF27_01786 [Cafeteria roenbergensis]|eukprot:KAA0146165.1 hypothetical protein FNF29_08226 [Cafeteria roenbergensis]